MMTPAPHNHTPQIADDQWRRDNGTTVSDEIISINGNLNAHQGKVEHPGSVVVQGDINAGVHVRVGGDLEVDGTIKNATIQAGGALRISGGISSCFSSPIRAGGEITARFINESTVYAEEDVTVANEIICSHVFTRGAINLQEGRFRGGELIALKGITCAEVGSRGEVAATLRSAVDPFLQERIEPLMNQVDQAHATIERCQQHIQTKLKSEKTLSAAEREEVTERMADLQELEASLPELNEPITQLHDESRLRASCAQCIVLGTIYPGTWIQIGTMPAQEIQEEVRGPALISYSRQNSRLFFSVPHHKQKENSPQ